MPTSSSAAFCCMLCRRASIASATTVSSPMASAVIASLSVVGCSKPVPRVPSTSLPTITPNAIARSLLLTSPSVLIAVAPCGGSQSCHAPATLSHSPATRHDVPTDAHGDRTWSQSCGQRCQHRHRAADQSFQSAMPTVPAPEIDATTAHRPRSPVPRANKPISARTLQPRLNVQAPTSLRHYPHSAPTSRAFVQSGFYEVALTTHAPGPFSHATSQNPQDSQISCNMIQGGKRRAVCHGDCHCGTDGLFQQRASPAGKPSEERRTSTPAVGHSGRARRCLAGSGSKDWRHGSSDAAGLGDPVQRTGTRRSDQQVRTGCARQAHQKAQSVSRRSGGGRTDPGDPRCGALARLRPDHVSARGIRPLGVGRHGLSGLEGAGLFACERQAQGLQAGCRCRGNVQKNFPSRVAQIRAKLAPGTPIEVWCQDEMRVGQKNKLTYRWARKGSRPRATHDQRTESTYLFGAVCPERGTGAALVLPACNSEAMQLHLDEIATKVTSGAHAIVLLDQAGWHGTKMLKVPSNMSLMPLPPRAPELNGQENIWQFMRQNWLSNRVFKSFDDIVDHCCYGWNTLIDQPWKIMSVARRDWAIVGHSM